MDVIPPIHHVTWKNCWRVIPTRYPSENLMDRVTDPKDVAAVEKLDALTNTRLRLANGDLNVLPSGEIKRDPGNQYVSASFAYSMFNSSRFSDGTYGVYYGSDSLSTAVSETVFHREKFMRATKEGPMTLPMRALVATLNGHLHDIRRSKNKYPGVYSSTTYNHSQQLGRTLWSQGSAGIIYGSVRRREGECVAVFKPSLLTHCRGERALLYEWNGRAVNKVYELREFVEIKKH